MAARAADVLALRGALTPFFGGGAEDLVSQVAWHLRSPERLMALPPGCRDVT